MHIAVSTPANPTTMAAGAGESASAGAAPNAFAHYQIIRRNGAVVPFEPHKIAIAMMKAFLAVHGTQGAASASVRETVDQLTQTVIRALVRSRPGGGTFHIEDVQDHVELGLMRGGHHEIARAYVLYRERRAQERARHATQEAPLSPVLHVLDGGQRVPLDLEHLQHLIESACLGLGSDVQPAPIVAETMRNLYDGVPMDEVYKASILAARTLIEKDPDYTYATARLLLHTIFKEVLGRDLPPEDMAGSYADYFPGFVKRGRRRRTARPQAAAVRPEAAGRGAQGRARSPVRLPRTADPVRPLLPARAQDPDRTAAGLLHAGGDGPGTERNRPRGARHRVLRSAVAL